MPKRTEQTREGLAGRVSQIAEEVLTGSPYYLVDVEVRGHRGTRVIEVYVDGDEEFGLDDLADISREVEFVLDVEDVVDGSYKLELSSPGLDRPLSHPRQFSKNVGRQMRVSYADKNDGAEKVEGELMDADEAGIHLDIPGNDTVYIPYNEITEAKIVLPW